MSQDGVACFVCRKVKHPVGPVDAWWTCGLCRKGVGVQDEWTPTMRERVAAQRFMVRLYRIETATHESPVPVSLQSVRTRMRRALYAYWREVDPDADVPALCRICAGLNELQPALTPNECVGQARLALKAWQSTIS